MDPHTFYETSYSWGDAGGYVSYPFDVPLVIPVEPAHIVPGQPPYNVSASTASTTTAGSTPRRTLTNVDRRWICEYHESFPYVKHAELGAMFGVERSTVSKVLRQKEKHLKPNDGSQNSNTTSLSETPNSYTSVSSPSSEPAPSPTSPNQTHRNTERFPSHFTVEPDALAKSEGQDESTPRMPGSSASPTQDDARQALDLVRRYLPSEPAKFLAPDEYAVVDKLVVKLSSSISEGTAVLLGPDKPLSSRASKKRRVEAVTPPCGTGVESVSYVNVY